jgi:hypothetical protein
MSAAIALISGSSQLSLIQQREEHVDLGGWYDALSFGDLRVARPRHQSAPPRRQSPR